MSDSWPPIVLPDVDVRVAAVSDVLGSHDPRYGFEVCTCGFQTPDGYRQWLDHVATRVLARLDEESLHVPGGIDDG